MLTGAEVGLIDITGAIVGLALTGACVGTFEGIDGTGLSAGEVVGIVVGGEEDGCAVGCLPVVGIAVGSFGGPSE